MLKSCSYCGRIHDSKKVCKQRQQAEQIRWTNRKLTKALMFRRSSKWTEKSVQIRERDNYMCLCCRAMLEGTKNQFNTTDISVHHIVPIEEDYGKRLDEENLITVCGLHHELCESGRISRKVQSELVKRSIDAYEEL